VRPVRARFASSDRRARKGPITAVVLGSLLSGGAAFAEGSYLLESGVEPYVDSASGWILSADFWPAHRFEVTEPTRVSAAGYFMAGQNPGDSSEVFAAIVALEGPTDLPTPRDLSGSDVLATSLMLVAADPGDYSAPFDLPLQPGWYMVVFGFGAFGADTQTAGASPGPSDGWADGAPGQGMYSLLPNSGSQIETAATSRLFVVPEPGAAGVCAAAFAALVALRRRR